MPLTARPDLRDAWLEARREAYNAERVVRKRITHLKERPHRPPLLLPRKAPFPKKIAAPASPQAPPAFPADLRFSKKCLRARACVLGRVLSASHWAQPLSAHVSAATFPPRAWPLGGPRFGSQVALFLNSFAFLLGWKHTPPGHALSPLGPVAPRGSPRRQRRDFLCHGRDTDPFQFPSLVGWMFRMGPGPPPGRNSEDFH